jgi:hypothetical protein
MEPIDIPRIVILFPQFQQPSSKYNILQNLKHEKNSSLF